MTSKPLTAEQIQGWINLYEGDHIVLDPVPITRKDFLALCDMALRSLQIPEEPTEEEVSKAASVIADSPLIDSPKLPAPSWYGLARAVLRAAREG